MKLYLYILITRPTFLLIFYYTYIIILSTLFTSSNLVHSFILVENNDDFRTLHKLAEINTAPENTASTSSKIQSIGTLVLFTGIYYFFNSTEVINNISIENISKIVQIIAFMIVGTTKSDILHTTKDIILTEVDSTTTLLDYNEIYHWLKKTLIIGTSTIFLIYKLPILLLVTVYKNKIFALITAEFYARGVTELTVDNEFLLNILGYLLASENAWEVLIYAIENDPTDIHP